MIETGLVYIYSISPARAFKGCGALIEGGYAATCRHVWRDAIARPNGETGALAEVEIEFPFVRDKGSSTSRATVADACEEPEGRAPDLVLLRPDTIPSPVMTLQLATKERFETGAGRAHTYLTSRRRYSTVDGRIDAEAGPDGRDEVVRVSGRLLANNGDILRTAALDGLGIALLPSFIAGEHVRSGALVRLLPDSVASEGALYAVYPPGRHLSAKLRSFIDFLAARFGEAPEWDRPAAP